MARLRGLVQRARLPPQLAVPQRLPQSHLRPVLLLLHCWARCGIIDAGSGRGRYSRRYTLNRGSTKTLQPSTLQGAAQLSSKPLRVPQDQPLHPWIARQPLNHNVARERR